VVLPWAAVGAGLWPGRADGGGEQPPRALHVHVGRAAEEVAGPEPAALGGRRQGGGMDDGVGTGDRLGDDLAAGQVPSDPVDGGILAGGAGQDADLVVALLKLGDDVASEMAGATGDQHDVHVGSLRSGQLRAWVSASTSSAASSTSAAR
jgi:hypothetical protein